MWHDSCRVLYDACKCATAVDLHISTKETNNSTKETNTCTVMLFDAHWLPHSYVWYDPRCSYVWHDVFIWVIWPIHVCAMTHSYVWHDSFIRVVWLWYDFLFWMSHVTYMDEPCHTYEWVMSHMNESCNTYVTQMRGMTFLFEWHDSLICVTWLIHKCGMTNSHSCGQIPANAHVLGAATRCNTLQHTAICPQAATCERSNSRHCNTLQRAATRCNTLQHACRQPPANAHILGTAIHCNTMQHAATCCNTLKHTCGQPLANAHILGAAMPAQTPSLLASVFRV